MEQPLLLLSGRLLQQFVVDTFVKIETMRLWYLRDHQDTIRADLYQGLQDAVASGETTASKNFAFYSFHATKKITYIFNFLCNGAICRKRWSEKGPPILTCW